MKGQINTVQVTVPNNEGITGRETVFTFTFSENTDVSQFQAVFDISEKKVVQDNRFITKPLKPVLGNPREGTAGLTFPEALAGASLEIKCALIGLNAPASTLNIKVKRLDEMEEIERVYWAEQEFALWGATLDKREEAYINEDGFLHIYTKGMFGHDVYSQIKGSTSDITKALEVSPPYLVRDNVLSIPYSMAAVLSLFKSKVPAFNENELKLYAVVSKQKPAKDFQVSNDLVLHCNQRETNPVTKTTLPPVKVIVAEEEEEDIIVTKAECSLEFRPDSSYHGEYGFSWIHTGDTAANEGNPFNDYDYRDIMGKQYKIVNGKIYVHNDVNEYEAPILFDKDPPGGGQVFFPEGKSHPEEEIDSSFRGGVMFERMARTYRQLLFGWKENATGKPFRTFVPVVTTMLNKDPKDPQIKELEINLDLYFDVREVPEKIVLQFDDSEEAKKHFKLSDDEFTNIPKGKSNSIDNAAHKLTVTCTSEFSKELILYARAVGKNDPKGTICGALRFYPNSVGYQRKLKLVVYNVITNLENSTNDRIGGIEPKEITKLHNILSQTLTSVHIETEELDTTKNNKTTDEAINKTTDGTTNKTTDGSENPNYFRERFCKMVNNKWVIDYNNRKEMQEYLTLKGNPRYKDYYKIFVFDEKDIDHGGYSSQFEKYTVVFTPRPEHTCPHEFLHSLGLFHSFDGYSVNTLFTYQSRKTNNVMDYSHDVGKVSNYLEYWQWQIINVKIRRL